MTIKQFKDKAKEGGFDPNGLASEAEMFLSPEAWRACGKVEGWSNSKYRTCELKEAFYTSHTEKPGRKGTVVGESRDGKNWWIIWNGTISRYSYHKNFISVGRKRDNWKLVMLRMVEARIAGKSIEEFLKTL